MTDRLADVRWRVVCRSEVVDSPSEMAACSLANSRNADAVFPPICGPHVVQWSDDGGETWTNKEQG